MKQRFEAAATGEVERTGMNAWDGESLPLSLETPGGHAWPALVDERGSVGIRAFTCEADAAQAHRAGGARLLLFGRPEQAAYLAKKFPLGIRTKVELPRLGHGGTTLDDLLLLAAEGAAGGKPFPRSPDAIRSLAETSRAHWHDAAARIGQALEESLELLPEIRTWIAKHQKDRNHAPIAADLDAQLHWLFRPRFVWHAGFSRLCDYPRRLRAIRSRLGRIASLPLIKDLEKLDRLQTHWQPWFEQWTQNPDAPRLWEHGWLLEEFRIALFAPDVTVTTKVSEKILENSFGNL
jgi:ATP-dependent helicase HrpA